MDTFEPVPRLSYFKSTVWRRWIQRSPSKDDIFWRPKVIVSKSKDDGEHRAVTAMKAPGSEEDACFGESEIFWWSPSKSIGPVEFCSDTSLHGLKYIGQAKRHISERIFWIVVFITAVSIAAFFINTVWDKYNSNPVIISFRPQETNIDIIPFPAITICNVNNILKSKAREIIDNSEHPSRTISTHARRQLYLLDHVCSTSPSFSRAFNFSSDKIAFDTRKKLIKTSGDSEHYNIGAFFRSTSQPCDDMILLCSWLGEPRNCSEIFTGIMTDFGFCCTFNMVPQTLLHRYQNDSQDTPELVEQWSQWDLKAGILFNRSDERFSKSGQQVFPRRQRLRGKSSGLSLLLHPNLNEYYCSNTDSVGFQMVAHPAHEVPHVADSGTALRPNSEVFIEVKPEVTVPDDNVIKFTLNQRNCYFEGEFELHFYKYYSASNCIDECMANETFAKCQCVRYYMPRDDDRPLCELTQVPCTVDVRRQFFEEGIKAICKDCLPSCSEIEYNLETTSLPIQKEDIWTNKNETAFWANKSVSIVHIFVGSDGIYARLRNELYGTTDLIANTGGLLGLCMGFSGVSAVEILYFMTLRAFWKMRRKRIVAKKVVTKFKEVVASSRAKQMLNTHKKRNPIVMDSLGALALRKPSPAWRDIKNDLEFWH